MARDKKIWGNLRTTLVLSSFALFGELLLSACARLPANSSVTIGPMDAFPLGSVTRLELRAAFDDPDPPAVGSETPGVITQPPSTRVSPVVVFLLHSSEAGFRALYARDPFRGCQIRWSEGAQRFADPCHGSLYGTEGEWLSGPGDRGMDWFGVLANGDGKLVIDLAAFQFGNPHP